MNTDMTVRHPGGRTCAGMVLLGAAVPALLFALAFKVVRRGLRRR